MIARISKADKSIRGTIQLPPSKSIYNRVLILRSLCDTDFKIFPEPTAGDSVLLQKLLQSTSSVLDAEDAGTTLRFLTACLAQKPGEWLLTGSARMKKRPIGPLVDALREKEADIEYESKEGYPPLIIKGKKIKGGSVQIDGSVSSQFISALLMIAPTLEGGIELTLTGVVQSHSYIRMTLELMKKFGVDHTRNRNVIRVSEQKYHPKDFVVEPDWSSASYWYEMAALSEEADICLHGLNANSVQGDATIAELMKPFGVETEYEKDGICLKKKNTARLPENFSYNFQSHPDLVQTMAATCAALTIPAELSGVASLRIKETDRLKALKNELEKTGVTVTTSGEQLSLKTANRKLQTANLRFQTYNDHRMALAMAPMALMFNTVEIENPGAVSKSYPDFFKDLQRVGFKVELFKTEP